MTRDYTYTREHTKSFLACGVFTSRFSLTAFNSAYSSAYASPGWPQSPNLTNL
jgi:hypothetical protein